MVENRKSTSVVCRSKAPQAQHWTRQRRSFLGSPSKLGLDVRHNSYEKSCHSACVTSSLASTPCQWERANKVVVCAQRCAYVMDILVGRRARRLLATHLLVKHTHSLLKPPNFISPP